MKNGWSDGQAIAIPGSDNAISFHFIISDSLVIPSSPTLSHPIYPSPSPAPVIQIFWLGSSLVGEPLSILSI